MGPRGLALAGFSAISSIFLRCSQLAKMFPDPRGGRGGHVERGGGLGKHFVKGQGSKEEGARAAAPDEQQACSDKCVERRRGMCFVLGCSGHRFWQLSKAAFSPRLLRPGFSSVFLDRYFILPAAARALPPIAAASCPRISFAEREFNGLD